MINNKFPYVSKELLEHLEKAFPDRMPETEDGLESIRFKQGQVSVVRHLRYQFNNQTKKVLEK